MLDGNSKEYVRVFKKSITILANCLKITETNVVLNVFKGVICDVASYTVTVFFSVAQQESDTRKTIFWSVIVYSKHISSQCNLNAQIEPVQDK
jgi:hemoglobin-like flavoprotein